MKYPCSDYTLYYAKEGIAVKVRHRDFGFSKRPADHPSIHSYAGCTSHMNYIQMNCYILVCTEHLWRVMWGYKYKGSRVYPQRTLGGELQNKVDKL